VKVPATRSWSRWMQTASLTLPLVTFGFLTNDEGISWWLALAGLIAIVAGLRHTWQCLHLDEHGLTIRRRPGRERVAWSDIDRVEVRWLRWSDGGDRSGLRSFQPLIERTDGRRVRSQVLADLIRDGRTDERHAVSELLADRAAEHGFELVIHGPGAEGTRTD